MRIPLRNTAQFVREVANQCNSTRQERVNRGRMFEAYATTGSSDEANPAAFNKIFSSLDDLESLLFSPVSLKFHIADADIPNIVNEAKGRAAAARIRQLCRQADADSLLSQAVGASLRKGLGLTKQLHKGKLSAHLVQPENFGVMRENHNALDQDMEAFCHTMLITKYQADRLVQGRPDEAEARAKMHRAMKPSTGSLSDAQNSGSALGIITGGYYPLQAAGSGSERTGKGDVIGWMSTPKAQIDPAVLAEMIELQEVWVWDDKRNDWATFQLLGEDILLLGRYQIVNSLAYDPQTKVSSPELQGCHPFTPFCVNPIDGYFWGLSEVARLILLQEAINARITGINRLLRKQEDPATKFVGSTGVNQNALSRFNKPGGYYSDSNPNAKIERDTVTIPADAWAAVHEFERMFDELMGLPPIAKGQGEQGVRSGAHADTLVRMFSPRFKDRALLVERDVEKFGALTLDLARAHEDRKLWCWVPEKAAGNECTTSKEELEFLKPPAPGFVPVLFTFADLPDDVTLTVDSHSSSPAFSQDAKALAFDLLKVGGMDAATLVDHVDISGADELQAGIARREAAKAEAAKAQMELQREIHHKNPGSHK